jgi:hypothetical protein
MPEMIASSTTATAAGDYVGITNPCMVSSVPLCRFRRLFARAEYLRQLARKYAAAADAAGDPVTKAKFEQEQRQWLFRAEQAEKAERNLMTRASGEGRLRKPALSSALPLTSTGLRPQSTFGRSGQIGRSADQQIRSQRSCSLSGVLSPLRS